MFDERTEERAALYALGLLSGEERSSFELSMEGDPELRKLVRQFSSALHAPAKDLEGPSRPDLLGGILARVEKPGQAPVSRPVSTIRRAPSALPWAHIWAAAAVLFLFLNVSLLLYFNEDSFSRGSSDSAIASSDGGSLQSNSSVSNSVYPVNRSILEARIARLEESLADRDERLRQINNERIELKEDYDEVRSYNAGWQREYARLAARFLPFFDENDGLSRFTVIEMVDADAYVQGLPRLGFNELAARYLTGEGNIAGVGSDEFVGPVVEGAGIASAVSESFQGGLTPIAQADMPGVAYSDMRSPESGSDPAAATVESSPRADEVGQRPAGFTVWRDDEQKGFLDLYNLPMPVEGEEAFLWVRSSELEPYLPIGAIPDLDNGTGSLFYSVDEPNFTPSEILITSEPPDARSSEPTGPILLRGP
jgi:hypothetical protein